MIVSKDEESIPSTNENESRCYAKSCNANLDMNEDEQWDQYLIHEYERTNNVSRYTSIYINLPFIPPPTHMCETCVSRPPVQSVKDKIDQFGVEMKEGVFNPVEDKIIIKNWESFSKEYMLDDPSVFFSLKNFKRTERIKFAQYIGHNLPHRYLYSIIMRFINLYQLKKSGRFDDDTDYILLRHMKRHKVPNYIKLSKILNRDKHSIYRRCQILKQQIQYPELCKPIKWNYELAERLLRSLLRICNIDDIEVLKDKTIHNKTWLEVEKEFCLPAKRFKKFWQRKLYTQLFSVNTVTQNEIYIKLIEVFCQRKYKYWEDVKWNDILSCFDVVGLTSAFLYHRWRVIVTKYVPYDKRRKVKKTVKILKSLIPTIQKSKNYTLERIVFTKHDGLKVIPAEEY